MERFVRSSSAFAPHRISAFRGMDLPASAWPAMLWAGPGQSPAAAAARAYK